MNVECHGSLYEGERFGLKRFEFICVGIWVGAGLLLSREGERKTEQEREREIQKTRRSCAAGKVRLLVYWKFSPWKYRLDRFRETPIDC